MKGLISFHPLDTGFFDEMIAPLVAGRKVNPERFVGEAVRLRKNAWHVRRYARALESALAGATPPEAAADAKPWSRVKSFFDRFDFRPEETSRRAAQAVEPDLHLCGRPFLVAEDSATKVAEIVERFAAAPSPDAAEAIAKEQLTRLDPELGRLLVPEDGAEISADLLHRRDLLAGLAAIRSLADAARRGVPWGEGDASGKPAVEVLRDEIAWRALALHARIVPFWVGRDVDGLETVCAAASVPPPEALVPARRVFAGLCEEFPDFGPTLGIEITRPRQVGAYVAPDDVPSLLEFLGEVGARIIQVAARHGEGAACSVLLRKMRECATYAKRRGFGYLEASGILPPDVEAE